jgi:hypothetical protein
MAAEKTLESGGHPGPFTPPRLRDAVLITAVVTFVAVSVLWLALGTPVGAWTGCLLAPALVLLTIRLVRRMGAL